MDVQDSIVVGGLRECHRGVRGATFALFSTPAWFCARRRRAASSAAETDDSFKSMGGLFHPALSPRPVWGARQVPPGLPRLDLATVMRKNAKEPETSDDKRGEAGRKKACAASLAAVSKMDARKRALPRAPTAAPAPRIEAQHASAEARALSRVLQEARSRPRGGADVPTRQQRGRSVEGAPRSRPGALPQGQTWKVLDPVVAGTRSVSQQPSGGSMGRFAPPPATSGDTGVAIAGSNAARSVGHGHNRVRGLLETIAFWIFREQCTKPPRLCGAQCHPSTAGLAGLVFPWRSGQQSRSKSVPIRSSSVKHARQAQPWHPQVWRRLRQVGWWQQMLSCRCPPSLHHETSVYRALV